MNVKATTTRKNTNANRMRIGRSNGGSLEVDRHLKVLHCFVK